MFNMTKIIKAVVKKKEPKVEEVKEVLTTCSNCNDSGLTCNVCRVGFDE